MIHPNDSTAAVTSNPLPTLGVELGTGRVFAWNHCAEVLFGQEAFASGNIAAILESPHNELAVFLEAVEHFGSYADAEVRFCRADRVPLRLQTFGICADQSDRNAVILSFLDLDAQDARNAQAEEAAHQRAGLFHWQRIYGFFKELEADNHLILEAAGEGIYGINAQGKATFVNRAAQEMLGWSAEDLIGRELHAIIHHSKLDGCHFPAQECPIYSSFRLDKTVRVEDDAFWRKDGKPILVEYVSTPIYDHGVLAGAVVIFRDVTERKENEKKLREALAEVDKLRQELEQENDYLLTEIRSAQSHTGLIGTSPFTRNLAAQINLVADTKTNVLVTGPHGSGKSLIVNAIHESSERRKRPLVRVNCADMTERELTKELFGYRKGAFPGAMRDVAGKIALAANGTLFFDEVTELPKPVQARLLEVIQNRSYCRIGDTSELPVDLRIVSTTSRDLQAEVKAKRFREDLFFELSVFPIHCAPLKDHVEDIPHLAQNFLDMANKRLRLPNTKLTKANIDVLLAYSWPGNVRELKTVIERAAVLAQGGKLKFDLEGGKTVASNTVMTDAELRQLERDNLVQCLRRSKGKVSGAEGAAKLLGVAPTTVYSRIKAFEIDKVEWAAEHTRA